MEIVGVVRFWKCSEGCLRICSQIDFVSERNGGVKNVSKGFVLIIVRKDRVSINQDGKSLSGFLGKTGVWMLHIQNWRCLLDMGRGAEETNA